MYMYKVNLKVSFTFLNVYPLDGNSYSKHSYCDSLHYFTPTFFVSKFCIS